MIVQNVNDKAVMETTYLAHGDATWILTGSSHSLLNNGDEDLVIIVVASPNW
jgi:mannose-6-phosphate isomerase-like protein (cupin superfamily)